MVLFNESVSNYEFSVWINLTIHSHSESQSEIFDLLNLFSSWFFFFFLLFTKNCVYLRHVRLRACPHGDAFSCICKNVVSNRRFVQTDPVFWEPETAIIWSQDPKWINLKTSALRFRVYSQSVYFVKRWLRHVTATTTWTNNVFLLTNITDQYIYCSMFVLFVLLCLITARRIYAHAPSRLLHFSVSLWDNYSATYWSGMYTTSFWVCFSSFIYTQIFLETTPCLHEEKKIWLGKLWLRVDEPLN